MKSVPTLVDVKVSAVLVPFNLTPLTSSGSLSHAALVLIDAKMSDDTIGRAYLFSFGQAMLKPLLETVKALAGTVIGEPLAPLTLDAKLRKTLRLMDTPGLVGLGLAGLDMAFWDAHAKGAGLPLAVLLGSCVTEVRAYNSCGLWIQPVEGIADEAEQLLASHDFSAVKLRLGREDPGRDLQAVRNVRDRIGDDKSLMVDFNQSQTVASAIARCTLLDDEGLYWIEEPLRHGNFEGTAAVRNSINTALQTGENLNSTFDLSTAIGLHAADFYMPDVQRIGGVTGWLRAAALCHAAEIEMSSHLFPEFSVHLLAATPTRHWLEYVDWANPILEQPIKLIEGMAQVPQTPGVGIEWNEDAVNRYLVC